MSGPPDYSFSLVSFAHILNWHSGVGRAASIIVRFFIGKLLGCELYIRFQGLEVTLNHSLVKIVGVTSIFAIYLLVPSFMIIDDGVSEAISYPVPRGVTVPAVGKRVSLLFAECIIIL